MGKYRKKAGKSVIVIPGVGAIANDRVLEGDYERFVPGLLERVPEGDSAPAPEPELESQRPTLVEPEKVTEPVPAEPEEEPEEEEEASEEASEEEYEDEEPVPDMTWLKHELVTYAENMGIALEGSETKHEILDAINEAP